MTRGAHNLRSLALGATLLALAAASAAAAPVARLEPNFVDFGELEQQETRSAEVVITNAGDEPLKILDIEASCGCTTTALARNLLQPGESVPLQIDFSSKNFSGDQTKVVAITTNDPRQPLLEILIKAYVKVALMIDPPLKRVAFARSPYGQHHTKQVTFTATEQPRLEVDLERYNADLFDLEVVNNYEGNPQVAVLKVTVDETMPAGRHRDIVQLTTNVPGTPRVDIELRCEIVQDLILNDDDVRFRYVMPGDQLRKTLKIVPFEEGTRFSITGAEIDVPGLTAAVEEKVPNGETHVLIDGRAIPTDDERAVAAKGRMKGTLKIYTDLASQPVIEVPVSYLLRI
jgi:hypothetical protein